jgi:hypothetical protein
MACLIYSVLIGCKKDSSSVGPLQGKDDAAFAIYENSFLEGLWKLNPDWATSVGYHNTIAYCLYRMTRAGTR